MKGIARETKASIEDLAWEDRIALHAVLHTAKAPSSTRTCHPSLQKDEMSIQRYLSTP